MPHQFMKRIRDLDVFSLLVFKYIFESGHANVVAKELEVSAPKVSRCLNALRHAFDDDLFYRRQQGLKPTPVAEKIYPYICKLSDSLTNLEQLVRQQNPQDQNQIVTIAASSMLIKSLAIKLAHEQAQQQIGKVELSVWDDNSANDIHSGKIDLGFTCDTPSHHDLTSEAIAEGGSICVVAKDTHPIWQLSHDITLEDICAHPFLYLYNKGFNDRVDPLEVFCRENELTLPSVAHVRHYDEWFSHMLTMGSIAFAPIMEMASANQTQGLKALPLSSQQILRLHNALPPPKIFLVETTPTHRRYSEQTRALLTSTLQQLFY